MASESVADARLEVLSWPIDWPAAGRAYNQETFEADVADLEAAVRKEAVAEWRERVQEAVDIALEVGADALAVSPATLARLRALLEASQEEGE